MSEPAETFNNFLSLIEWERWLRTLGSIQTTYAITMGDVTGKDAVRRFGHNELIGNTWETMYHGSNLYTYLTSAEILKIASTDVDDDGDPADTGARTLFIQGLDGNYEIASETRTLNGNGVVDTVGTYLRVFKIRVETAGTSGTNEGTITIKNAAQTVTLASIPIGEGESHLGMFTVPADQTLYITNWYGSEITNKGITFGLFVIPFGKAWTLKRQIQTMQNTFFQPFDFPLKFTEKTDIEIRVVGSAVDGEATGGFSGWREDN